MPFTAEISRTNPTCLLFLVDQSTSMDEPFGAIAGTKKSEGVSDGINRLLQNLVLKCAKADGVRDYFYVGVLGYGKEVAPALHGTSEQRPLLPISVVANAPVRVEQRKRLVDDGNGCFTEQTFRFPIWFEPTANGKTPMFAALQKAREIIASFLKTYPDCFPPIVLNLTDGRPTDANPHDAATDLKALKSSDGNVLLFNAHLSSSEAAPICFPAAEDTLPDIYAKVLFRMSSLLPHKLLHSAKEEGFQVQSGSRGFVFNADLVSVVRFLEIGTRVASSTKWV